MTLRPGGDTTECIRGLLLFLVLAAGLAAAPAHARLVDHNPVTTPDPTGDSGAAPDITGITVANSLAGEILFVVQVANRTDLVANDVVVIRIDSDQNAATGEADGEGGIDYMIAIDAGARQIGLLRWTGTEFVNVEPVTSLRGAWINAYVVAIGAAELGNTRAFRFYAGTALIEGADDAVDTAPTDVYLDYALAAPHVQTITPRWAPAAPRAGRTFRLNSVRLNFETEETGAAATFSCRATLAGKRIRGTGRGGCTFRLAASARGKRLSVTITAAPAGGRAQTFRAYTFRVR